MGRLVPEDFPLDALDDQDDVDEVFANFDIPENVLEELAA